MKVKKLNLYRYLLSMGILLFATIMGCSGDQPNSPETLGDIEIETDLDLSDWTSATHSNDADPDYDIVFPQDQVNRIDLVISSINWNIMLEDMTNKYGNFGSRRNGPPVGSDENPIYVPCSLHFNGIEWYQVGVRFKGNSSLQSSWANGIWKLPLRLNLDRFEEEYPEINNQRFYGFKELSLSNAFEDQSLIREKVVPEIFRDFGVAAPQTAFYRVYIDYGDGSIYFGLYTMVEIVDDTVIEEHFADDSGNLYKPEGPGASFAENMFNFSDFEKKTNEETDWSDIESVFEILHSDSRIENAELWRASLEQAFNTDIFLKWLAVNTTVQNWDTYGKMTHNYYLYNDPGNNKLTWIPWDNNEALKTGKQGGAISVSCEEVGSNWPLIRYLLDDEKYLNIYHLHLRQVIVSVFEPSKMTAKYQNYSTLIREYAIGNNGEQTDYTFLNSSGDFDSAISELISHVNSRYTAVEEYLEK
jgi:spore coat protein CotH